MLTFLPMEQITEMEKWEGSQLNRAKEILAYELTALVHGEEEAGKAEASAKQLFMGQGSGNDLPTVELKEEDFTDGVIDVMTLLVKAELCTTKSDARRNVQQGGVTIENVKITDISHTVSKEDVAKGILVRRGKKNYCRVICG
jgi:tyrosyl-tRNA synthetase